MNNAFYVAVMDMEMCMHMWRRMYRYFIAQISDILSLENKKICTI